jgi:hypothetical protein
MNYEEFGEHVLRCMHETIYDDTEGREILIIRLLDAFAMTNKAVRAEREACAQLCDDSVEYAGSELARQIRSRK